MQESTNKSKIKVGKSEQKNEKDEAINIVAQKILNGWILFIGEDPIIQMFEDIYGGPSFEIILLHRKDHCLILGRKNEELMKFLSLTKEDVQNMIGLLISFKRQVEFQNEFQASVIKMNEPNINSVKDWVKKMIELEYSIGLYPD